MDEQSIFLQALDRDTPEEQAKWLDEICGRETPLRQRIDALLKRHLEASRFLEKPLMDASPASNTSDGDLVDGNHSVLKALSRMTGELSHVYLREPAANGIDPIVRPASPEVPNRKNDSRYQLLGEIAQGGMGAIIKARDTDLGRDLAIKVLLERHKDKPDVIRRFVEEAQIGGQLQHPGIAPVYELGQFSDQRPFFSMKLVRGQTLSALLVQRDDPSRDRGKFLGIFEQVCQTVAYAHSRSVIHRDLKPANIMVGAFGEVQVMDWGLAKVLSTGGVADERKERTNEDSIIETLRSVGSDTPEGIGSQTLAGSVMGTPAYMSPEQALGETDRLDERSDVFALGAILCVILTGDPPYVGEDSTQVFRQATRGKLVDCFARLGACGADSALIDLARQCLEVEPNDRPRDAGALAEQVSRYLESVETRLRETELERAAQAARAEEERKRFRVTLALAASVLLLIGLAGGGWLWISQQQAERRRVATAKVTEAVNEAKLHEGRADAADLDVQLQELELAIKSAELARDLTRQEDVEDTVQQDADQLLKGLVQRAATVQEQAEQAQADREFQNELEAIRLGQADLGERLTGATFFSVADADQRYERAFRKAGLDLLALDVSEAAARIKGRDKELRESIIGGLDNWLRSLSDLRGPPDQRYHRYVQAGDFEAAADVLLHQVERIPGDIGRWAQLAPLLVLTEDEAAYRDLCRRIAEEFGATKDVGTAEKALKACLLLPGAADLSQLPHRTLTASLDAGHLPQWFQPWAWSTRALLALRNGDYESALKFAEESMAHSPTEYTQALNGAVRALAHHRLGHVDESRGNLEEATAIVSRLLENEYNPSNHHDLLAAQVLLREVSLLLDGKVGPPPEKRLTRRERLLSVANQADANVWRRQVRSALKDRHVPALVELAESERSKEQSSELIAWLGAVLRDAGELQASVNVLKEAQQQHPGDFWLNHELAASLLYSEKPTEAVEFARAALAKKPNSLGSLMTLQSALGQAGRKEDYYRVRRQILPLIPLRIENSKALWSLSSTPRAQDKRDDHIALARGYTQAYPNDARGFLLLAMALGMVQERLEDALPPLKRFIELKPNDAPTYAYFTTYLGNTLTGQKKLPEAIEAYRLGIQFDPEDALIWMRLAPALAMAGDQAAYGDYCKKIVQHFAGTVNVTDAARVCKACLLMPSAIDLDEVPIESVAKSLDEGTAPYRDWFWNTRALFAYRNGDADAAIEYVRKSEESIPPNPYAPFAHALNLTIQALAYEELGHLDEARKYASSASDAIEALRRGPARTNDIVVHDVLIPQVLLSEAESLINAETASQVNQFERYTKAENYAAAAEIGLRLVEQDPRNTEWWLRLAPILVLTEDEAAYREFCRRMAEQFAATDDVRTAERTLKACLLWPDAIDLPQLPHDTLARSLDEGIPEEWFLPWGWFARALFEYRNGDYQLAINYAQESEKHNPLDFAKALNRAVLALAHKKLGHSRESRSNFETASAIISDLLQNEFDPGNHHDLLITRILLREAEKQIKAQ